MQEYKKQVIGLNVNSSLSDQQSGLPHGTD